MINLAALRARQPKELLQTDAFRTVPPEDLTPGTLNHLASERIMTSPAKVLMVYRRYASETGEAEASVAIRAMVQLGFLFDPNSFFSAADRQLLTSHNDFKELGHDLASMKGEVPEAAAPVLLYALACLEYRCVPLLPTLLDAMERNLQHWRTEVLSLALHSIAMLGLGEAGRPVQLEDGDGVIKDYSHLCGAMIGELQHRPAEEGSLHDWSRAAFATVMCGLYDAPSGGEPALPVFLENACAHVAGKEHLDSSGWAQFFLYQALYCTDVEKPKCEDLVKRAMPMWIQERLHERWLDSIVLLGQPQGADMLQRDIDESLKRTNTQALLNCSAGRAWDEQHCWFAGFLLEPSIALECDSMAPLSPGMPRPSGWLQLKARVLRKIGYTVVTMHRCFWERLSEDQKDEQIIRLRSDLGYQHDKAREKSEKRIRQNAHTYKGIETKKKEWNPMPAPISEGMDAPVPE